MRSIFTGAKKSGGEKTHKGVELKTVTGTRATLSKDFMKGYKQGASLIKNHADIKSHSVFIRLFSDLPIESVKAKIAGELKMRYDNGNFICFFETIAELHQWKYSELRAMINKKSPDLA